MIAATGRDGAAPALRLVEPAQAALAFGPFLLLHAQRRLLEDGQPVRLGSRALDLLIALAERAGEVVGRDELMARVWPREVVEENTLRVHVAALRKALGDGQRQARYITNVPGRGYCFVAELQRPAHAGPAPAPAPSRLPAPMARMVGRDDAVAALVRLVRDRRFVTIVGAGGMGKTTVAVAVADASARDHAQGVWFVDLSLVAPGAAVVEAFASALEVPSAAGSVEERLLAHLRGRRLLIVADNCEHVLEPLAPLVEAMLQSCPGVRLLATSREPVRAAGEWVHLLPALEFPRTPRLLDARQAGGYAAVQLFVERAAAGDDSFQLDDRNAALVAEACRRLDGIPLAIELTAALVRVFSLEGVLAGLETRLLALRRGQRTGVSRHQTLHAMLDWSHQLLEPFEKAVLHRLSVFRGGIPLASATAVAADAVVSRGAVRDAIAGLAAKSWLYADATAEPVRFHMHGLARSFARAHLCAGGEEHDVSARHAACAWALLRRSREDWGTLGRSTWLERYGPDSADVRAAIAWALEQDGGALRAEAMLADAWMLGFHLHQFADYEALARSVLDRLQAEGGQPLAEMRMHRMIALLDGPQIGPRTRDTLHGDRALDLARDHGGPGDLVESLLIRYVQDIGNGEFARALGRGEYLHEHARRSGDAVAVLAAERMCAPPQHLLGRHERCRELATRVLGQPAWSGAFGAPSGAIDHRVGMRIVLARIEWLQGRPDRAAAMCAELLESTSREDAMSLCQVIGFAALPIALWRGDAQLARVLSAGLREAAQRQALSPEWAPWVDAIDGLLRAEAEGAGDGPHPAVPMPQANALLVDHLPTFSRHGLTAQALQRVRAGTVGWCAPEVLRVQALALLERDGGRAEEAQALVEEALALARRQSALAWELRAATSLARLWQGGPREPEGQDLLAALLSRFGEGEGTQDLVAARSLLAGEPRRRGRRARA